MSRKTTATTAAATHLRFWILHRYMNYVFCWHLPAQVGTTWLWSCDVGILSTVSWILTCGFQELLGWPEDNVAVPVRAEEQSHQGSAVCHADPHVLVQEPLKFLSGPGRGGQERGLLKFTQKVTDSLNWEAEFTLFWTGFWLSTPYQRMYQHLMYYIHNISFTSDCLSKRPAFRFAWNQTLYLF